MDELIRDYIKLLNSYAILQQSLAKSASDSFISLSRCRYNNIKLFAENFRAENEAYLTVDLSRESADRDPTKDQEKEGADAVVSGASDQQVVFDTEKSTDHKPPSKTTSAISEKTTEEELALSSLGRWVSRTHKDKKKNPMRDIERLPSQRLRSTQTSFIGTVDLCITLANIYIDLQHAEEAIRQLRRAETQEIEALPLGELSVNEGAKETSAVVSSMSAANTDHIKAAGRSGTEEVE